MSRVRFGVLASGSGTNLQALLDATVDRSFPAEIGVVISDRRHAFALERAREAGVPAVHVPRRPHPSREAHDAAVVAALRAHDVQWVALAGYMRLITSTFLEAFPQRVLNIHPALLPAFPGLHAQRQALEAGVRIAGATVHFVDDGMDTGPVVIQGAVPVLPTDDEAALGARILSVEHVIYPRAVRWAAEGRLHVEADRVRVEGGGDAAVFGAP
jgi:phosphoribosylglycinamide formyltransferase-1